MRARGPGVGRAEAGGPSAAVRRPVHARPGGSQAPSAGRARRPDPGGGDGARGEGARAALTGRLGGGGGGSSKVSGLCPLGRSRLFFSALLAGPPASSLPARAPRARPLRPAPLLSELEPLAAAPGFPQCTARRSSHPIQSPRVRPPLPLHPGAPALTPSPRLRAPRRARDPPRYIAWMSVGQSPGRIAALALALSPWSAGQDTERWVPPEPGTRPELSPGKGSGPRQRHFSSPHPSLCVSSDTY